MYIKTTESPRPISNRGMRYLQRFPYFLHPECTYTATDDSLAEGVSMRQDTALSRFFLSCIHSSILLILSPLSRTSLLRFLQKQLLLIRARKNFSSLCSGSSWDEKARQSKFRQVTLPSLGTKRNYESRVSFTLKRRL